MKKRIYSLLSAFIISATASAQQDNLEKKFQDLLQKTNTVGLSVAVVKNSKLIYTHSFGLKDVEKNIPLSDNDIFRIASISKSFSATAIMQLAEAGKLSLDDDLSRLTGFTVRNPKFPDKVITLRMALSHTSSLNDSEGYFNLDVINPGKGKNWEKCYSDYAPGTKYSYCNLNFNMIGAIIERVSGQQFDAYIKTHILYPLGLYGGYWVETLDSGRFVTLYEYNAETKQFEAAPAAYNPRTEELKNYVQGYSTPVFSPTGGMKISAPDLARYMTMHMNYGKYNGKRIISKKSAKLMQTPLSYDEGYGLAIMTTSKLLDGKILKGHTGSAYGLFSAMFFDPKEKSGIVLITNGTNGGYKDGYNTIIKEGYNLLYQNFLLKR